MAANFTLEQVQHFGRNPHLMDFLNFDDATRKQIMGEFQSFNTRTNPKSYTPTAKDLTKSPFDTSYRTDPTTGQFVGSPLDASGRPIKPEFISIGDTSTGLLRPEYQVRDALDPAAYNAFMGEALRAPGQESVWGQMAKSRGISELAQQQAGQLSQAQNQLAMQGGLRSGARERLASQGAQQGMLGGQRIRGDVAMQDEATRQRFLSQAPQVAMQQAAHGEGLQKYNIEGALRELAQKRAYDIGAYNEAMRAWGAERTAAATPGGGGGKK